MDFISLGLVFIALIIFMATLYLTAGPASLRAPAAGVLNRNRDSGIDQEKNAIVVRLPKENSLPAEYILDLKLSLRRTEKEKPEMKEKNKSGGDKKYHRLDEYL